MKEYTRKIGLNRGKARLWLEGRILSDNGFSHGDAYHVETIPGQITITLHSMGSRKIAGKIGREIIDMSGATVSDAFDRDITPSVTIHANTGELIITAKEV